MTFLRKIKQPLTKGILVFCILSCNSEEDSNSTENVHWIAASTGTEETLYDIWGVSENEIWVVGDNGTILKCDGDEWKTQDSKTSMLLRGVFGFSGNDVYAVGGLGFDPNSEQAPVGVILHYDGENWVVVRDDIPYPLSAIWGPNNTEIYAVGGVDFPGDGPYLLAYDGTSWNEVTPPQVNGQLMDIWGVNDSDYWMITGDNILNYYTEEWQYVESDLASNSAVTSVWGTSEEDIFFTHCMGKVTHWDGSSISSVLSLEISFEKNVLMNFYNIWGNSDATRVYAVGGYWGDENGVGYLDGAMIYEFDGTEWIEHHVRKLSQQLYAVWGVSSTRIWAVGLEGTILSYQP